MHVAIGLTMGMYLFRPDYDRTNLAAFGVGIRVPFTAFVELELATRLLE